MIQRSCCPTYAKILRLMNKTSSQSTMPTYRVRACCWHPIHLPELCIEHRMQLSKLFLNICIHSSFYLVNLVIGITLQGSSCVHSYIWIRIKGHSYHSLIMVYSKCFLITVSPMCKIPGYNKNFTNRHCSLSQIALVSP